MTEIIMELSDEELPDYVNALLDQNRELRERTATYLAEIERLHRLRPCHGCCELFDVDDLIEKDYEGLGGEIYQFFACDDCHRNTVSPPDEHGAEEPAITTITDYVEKYHGGSI